MPIYSWIDASHDLTVHRMIGEFTVCEVKGAIHEYVTYARTLNDLWDARFTQARLLSPRDLQGLVDLASVKMTWRNGGRSAAVMTGTLNFGLGRALESLTRLARLPYEYRTFEDYDQALAWVTHAHKS